MDDFYSLINLQQNFVTAPFRLSQITPDTNINLLETSSLETKFAFYPTIETGILPVTGTGLLAHRAKNGYEQIIFQVAPEIAYVKWGQYEEDSGAVFYGLASPYKIIIADYENNTFIGIRHFFSPTPVTHWDVQLYATPFSNTNNLGYSGTSIGWVCIYPPSKQKKFESLSEKIDFAILMDSGSAVPYNFGNMSSTDGPTFYTNIKGSSHPLRHPFSWQEKTKKEGLNWILDPEILIPYRSKDGFSHDSNGPAYTLRRASFEKYAPYYRRAEIKPFNENKSNEDESSSLVKNFVLGIRTSAIDKKKLFLGDLFDKVNSQSNSLAFNEELNKSLSSVFKEQTDIIKCIICDNNFMKLSKAVSKNPIVIDVSPETQELIYSEDICHHCLSVEFSNIFFPPGKLTPWKKNLLVSCDFEGGLYPKHLASQCPSCHIYLRDSIYLIYGEDIEGAPIKCVSCSEGGMSNPEFRLDFHTKKYFLKEYALQIVSPIHDNKSVTIHKNSLKYFCKCGLSHQDALSENPSLDNLPSCVSCINQNLIYYKGKLFSELINEGVSPSPVSLSNS